MAQTMKITIYFRGSDLSNIDILVNNDDVLEDVKSRIVNEMGWSEEPQVVWFSFNSEFVHPDLLVSDLGLVEGSVLEIGKIKCLYDSFWTKGRKSKSIKTITVVAGDGRHFSPTCLPVPSSWNIKMFKCYVLQNTMRLHCNNPDRFCYFWKKESYDRLDNNRQTVGSVFSLISHIIIVSNTTVNVADPFLSPILEPNTWTPSQATFPLLDDDEGETSSDDGNEHIVNEPEGEPVEPEEEEVANEQPPEPVAPTKSVIVKMDLTGKEMTYDPEQTVLAFKKQSLNLFGIVPTKTTLKRMNFYYGDDPIQNNARKCKNVLTETKDVKIVFGNRGGGTRQTNKGNLYTKKSFVMSEKKTKVNDLSNEVKMPKIELIDPKAVVSNTIQLGQVIMGACESNSPQDAILKLVKNVPTEELRVLCDFTTPKQDTRITQICHLLLKHNATQLVELSETINNILASTASAIEYAVASNFMGEDGHWSWKNIQQFVQTEEQVRSRVSSSSTLMPYVAVNSPPAPFPNAGADEDL